jgi:hypothetical protein
LQDAEASTTTPRYTPSGLLDVQTAGSHTLNTIPASLIAASAAIILLLGLAHLVFTFYGPKLLPRDRDLIARMQETNLVLTQETSMWKAWIGFNASHSMGAILFGAVYGYLAWAHSTFLFQSSYLLSIGLIMLLGLVFLAKRYWFSVPFRGIILSTIFYALALFINCI